MAIEIDFSGKVVIVTGGGRGVGKGIVTRFLDAGADVVFCGRNEPESPPEAGGRKAVFVAADVRDLDDVDRLVTTTVERFGRLDVLVNNAGGAPPSDSATVSPRFNEAIVRLNLLAPMNLSQAANRVMQEQDEGGVIINIASISAIRPSPLTVAYAAAKAGLLAVTAGMVATEQSDLYYGDEEGGSAAGSTVPLQRLATPADIGDACVFLASPMASYVSGSSLLVHGGGEAPSYLEAVEETKE